MILIALVVFVFPQTSVTTTLSIFHFQPCAIARALSNLVKCLTIFFGFQAIVPKYSLTLGQRHFDTCIELLTPFGLDTLRCLGLPFRVARTTPSNSFACSVSD